MKGYIVKSLRYKIGAGLCSAALMASMAVMTLSHALAAENPSCKVSTIKQLEGIKIKALSVVHTPTRTVYEVNEQFDSKGILIAGVDGNNHMHILDSSLYILKGFNSATPGEKTITVELRTDNSISTSFPVDIVPIANGNYAISNLSQTSADGVVTVNKGAATINLDRVPKQDSTVTLRRGINANSLVSLTFTGNNDQVRNVIIERWALAQQSQDPTLTTVVFPKSLDTLTIGDSAFFQYSADGSGALKHLEFPYKVGKLTIGSSAFRQDVRLKASLEDVVFPKQVNMLSIGSMAFRQKFGVTSGLRDVILSVGGGTEVNIKELAFSASGSYMANSPLQAVVITGLNASENTTNITVGNRVFHRTNPKAQWFVQGLNEPTTVGKLIPSLGSDEELNALTVSPTAVLCFNPNDADTTSLIQHVPMPEALIPHDSSLSTVLSQEIPSRNGYEFAGWNTSADGSGMTYKPGQMFTTNPKTVTTVLYAQWRVKEVSPVPGKTSPVKKTSPKDSSTTPTKHDVMSSDVHKQMKKLAQTGISVSAIAVLVMALCTTVFVVQYSKRSSARKNLKQ